MDKLTMEEMNAKLDILFDQIEALPNEQRQIARGAVLMWSSAKTQEALGLGPMESRHIYHEAYDALEGMGLEVGGMIPPYRGHNNQVQRDAACGGSAGTPGSAD